MRWMVQSSFDQYSGYGNDAVDMCVWMARAGLEVVPWPDHLTPGLPREFTDLLTANPSGKYDVAMKFSPPFDLHPETFAFAATTSVGWSMWERTPLQRADMVGHGWGNVKGRKRWWSRGPRSKDGREKNWLDLMLVTCPMNVDAFQELDPYMKYAVVPNGIDPGLYPEMDRSGRDQPFTFATWGMLAGRKDPFATLAAWKIAKDSDPSFDARLVLKTSCSGLHPGIMEVYPDVEIIDKVWSRKQLVDWMGTVDCYVSTSRGEGNNKPAMEFMATGGPIMVTYWSGHQNYLHPDTGYALPGKLVENDRGVSDFRVDVETTAAMFLHVWRNQAEARRKGELAAKQIRATLSWEKVIERLVQTVMRNM